MVKNYSQKKEPEFVISSDFEFQKFSKAPNFAIANSLFSHLIEPDIMRCLINLRKFCEAGTKFYATYFLKTAEKENPPISHDHKSFFDTVSQMENFGVLANWQPNYIGEWNHPRGQVLMEYVAA